MALDPPSPQQRDDPEAHWLRNMTLLALAGVLLTLVLAASGVSMSELLR